VHLFDQGGDGIRFVHGCGGVLDWLGAVPAVLKASGAVVRLLQRQQRQTGCPLAEVDRLQPSRQERRRHPHRLRLAVRAKALPKGLKLSRGRQPHAHKLNLVEHPQAVVVQEPKVHRPPKPAHAVPTAQGAGEEHILRSDQDGVGFWFQIPFFRVLTSHEDCNLYFVAQTQHVEPSFCGFSGLLDQHAHGQAIGKPTRS
jgi:hypothetical protein